MNESKYFETTVYSAIGVRKMTPRGIGSVKEVRERNTSGSFQASVSLAGNVVFDGEDYQYFKDFARSDRRYDDVRAVVSVYCRQVKKTLWNTFIDVRKGEFDHSRCQFTCSLSLDNTNRAFENRKSDRFNLFNIVSSRVQTTPQYVPNIVYKNGIPIYTAILALFRETLSVASVTSDFFGWNSSNPGYTIGHNQLLKNQAFFQKSDIVRVTTPGYAPSSILMMSIEEAINNLCNLYNLQYTIDAIGNFRIEHVSWFTRGTGLDITAPRYAKEIAGTRRYSFDELKIYRVEKFTAEQSVNLDFVGYPIEYDNALIQNIRGNDNYQAPATTSGTSDTLERRVTWIVDIDAVYGNIGKSQASKPYTDQDLSGTVLLALTSSGDIEKINNLLETSYAGGTTPTQRRNNVNSWAILHDDYWKHDRLFSEGKMNNIQQDFVSLQRIKKRKTITVKICCDESLNVEDYVTTEDGLALIKRAEFDPYRETVTLDLVYTDTANLALNAPTANPDVYSVNVSETLDTSAAGKPSVLANDIGVVSVISEAKSTILGGSLNLGSNGHFTYIPPPGIIATDFFEYFGLSSTDRLDVGKVKIVIKTGGIYVHITAVFTVANITLGGFGGGDPTAPGYNPDFKIGEYHYYKVYVQYFDDPLLISPMDVTGLGLVLPYTWDIKLPDNSILASGSGTVNPGSGSFNIVADSGLSLAGANGLQLTFTGIISASPQYIVV